MVNSAGYFYVVPFLFSPIAMATEQFNTSFIRGNENAAQVAALSSNDDLLPGHNRSIFT